jgi:hypothetical protein
MWCGLNGRFKRAVLRRLDYITFLLERLVFKPVASFVILGGIVDIKPGQSTVLTAAPLDAAGAGTTLPSGDVPSWSVSDPTKVSATPSPDGLSLAVAITPGAAPGDIVFTITDGQITTATGTFTLTIPAPAPNPVASFAVTASTPV